MQGLDRGQVVEVPLEVLLHICPMNACAYQCPGCETII